MLENALLELQSQISDLAKKDEPAVGGSSNVVWKIKDESIING